MTDFSGAQEGKKICKGNIFRDYFFSCFALVGLYFQAKVFFQEFAKPYHNNNKKYSFIPCPAQPRPGSGQLATNKKNKLIKIQLIKQD